LSESQAILEYLEDAFPANPLYPAKAFERGKCREFIQHLDLNVELIARRLYAEAFFGRTVPQEIKDEVRAKITTGLTGLARLMKLSPYALGDRFTAADVISPGRICKWCLLPLRKFTVRIWLSNIFLESRHISK
jgi:glutathione S-transferase